MAQIRMVGPLYIDDELEPKKFETLFKMPPGGATARSDPWKPKITFLTKTHLDMLRNMKNVIFCYCNDI